MSSKKLILGIFMLFVIFIFFIRHAFISLQTVSLKIETHEIGNIEEPVSTTIEFLKEIKDEELIENFSLNNQQIVLVDNSQETAVLWNDIKDGNNKELLYKELPKAIKQANSYMIMLNNEPTVIINCDEILGDIKQRILVDSYEFLMLRKSNLNPKELNYFPTLEEKTMERFFRNQMIISLLKAYDNNESLEESRFYFEKWQEEVGDTYKSIAEYDYYEGSKEYMKVKLEQLEDNNFDLSKYVKDKMNKYSFFNKEQEYGLIGLLVILNGERKGIKIDSLSQYNGDIYKKLLYKTPYIIREIDRERLDKFTKNYNKYNEDMKNIIESFQYNNDLSFSMDQITSEFYTNTFMIDNNHYVYENYKARLKNKTIISKNYIIAEVSPYKVRYYYTDE